MLKRTPLFAAHQKLNLEESADGEQTVGALASRLEGHQADPTEPVLIEEFAASGCKTF